MIRRTIRNSGMASNVGRSMKSLMTAISTGMQSLGAGFRRPKLISNMFSSFIPKEPEYNIVHSSVPPPAVHYPAVQHKPVISYPQLEPINTPIVGNYVSASKPQYPVESQPPYSPAATPSHHPAVDSEPQYSVDIPSQQYYVPESPQPQKEQQYVPSNPVYTKPETSYAPPQPSEAAAAAPTTEQDEYGVPSGDLVPLGSYFVAPPQSAGSVQENKAPANTQIVLPQSEYTFNPEGNVAAPVSNNIENNQVHHLQGSSQGIVPLTVAPETDVFTISTTTLESYHHLTEEEICEHLRSLKEDIHKAGVSHAGGGAPNNIDAHKFVGVGVHTTVQKSSAVVPDQSHPEKYINLECEKIKEGHNVVRDAFHHNARL